jgi:hypothetical protein
MVLLGSTYVAAQGGWHKAGDHPAEYDMGSDTTTAFTGNSSGYIRSNKPDPKGSSDPPEYDVLTFGRALDDTTEAQRHRALLPLFVYTSFLALPADVPVRSMHAACWPCSIQRLVDGASQRQSPSSP